MSTPFSSLDLIPAFHAVMTHGSLSAAARALRLAQPTVRRHIEALEDELDTQLFTRAANGLTPTAMAQSLLPAAQAVLDEAAALRRAASAEAEALKGIVRITCSRVLAGHVMPQVLARLRRDTPGLRFELAGTDSTEDLLRRAADIAIRFAEPSQQALVALKLPAVDIGLFAAPHLPVLRHPDDLATVPFIADDREDRILPDLVAAGLPLPQNVVLRVDDPLAQIAHLEAGIGIGICQVKLAARLNLRRVLPQFSYPMPCWLLVHEDQARVRRIAHVFDALKSQLPALM